ncbi:Hypothetical predicted protein [Olea europaea subsp. europaea]|uniref:Uncharacterized protein n=1 Tax=Olea europaea subsp. europaea TaxID=158383 RepID=A0A8S0VAT5_OLEEU|nr:Hypothetical predicted protein [Olea europaea subsp. europaea]
MGNSSRESDRELLIPVADYVDHDDDASSSSSKPSPSASSSHLHSGREGVQNKLTTMRQALEASERKITNLNKTFHVSCKLKGEPSCGDTIALVNEHLMKRACGRFIRLYMQNVVLNYLVFAIQSLKVNVGPASTIAISFKLNDGNIIKNFPNMDACSALRIFYLQIRTHKLSRKWPL